MDPRCRSLPSEGLAIAMPSNGRRKARRPGVARILISDQGAFKARELG